MGIRGKRTVFSRWLPGSVALVLAIFSACTLFVRQGGQLRPFAKVTNPAVERGEIRAERIVDRRDLAMGGWAQATLGDYILENNQIKVIISDPLHVTGRAQSGGEIIDLARVEDNLDYFGHLYPHYTKGNVLSYRFTAISTKLTGYEHDAVAVIVTGEDTSHEGIQVENEYILEPDSAVLRIVTHLTNSTSATLSMMPVGDEIEWGATSIFVGGYGVPQQQEAVSTESDWVSGFADNFSAGIVTSKGKIKGTHIGATSELVYHEADLGPYQHLSYERYLMVADKSISKISDFTYKLKEIPYGYIAGRVLEMNTQKPVPDTDVRIISGRVQGKPLPARPFTRCYTNADGDFNMAVPGDASYFVQVHAFGREAEKRQLSFNVFTGESYVTEIQVSPVNTLHYRVMDADTGELIPCKITFLAIPPTEYLDFGPPLKAEGARNTYCSATGEGEIVVPAGRYRVVVSRGIEYALFEREMTITYGRENQLEARLKRVLDTSGYVSADIGVHTQESFNCRVSARDRVIAAVAEGVEYLVPGDSNHTTDLQPAIRELGLEKLVNSCRGKRIEFMGEDTIGRFMVFPLPRETQAATEASEPQVTLPEKLFQNIRKTYPDSLIAVDRPLFPDEGYFTLYGYNPKSGQVEKQKGFSYDFDALMIWEGKRMGAIRDARELMYQMLLQNHSYVPLGGSNSHFTFGEETGYPRVYFASPSDNPADVTEEMLVKAIRQGRVIITNGPFVRFTVNGQGPGSLVTDTDGVVDCSLEVYAAPWVDVEVIEIAKDGIFAKQIYQPSISEIKRYPRERTPDAGRFQLRAVQDVVIDVLVRGRKSLDPVVAPFSYEEGGGVVPFAITGPIFVDADGNGRYDPPPLDRRGW
jgi:hypothetical protein